MHRTRCTLVGLLAGILLAFSLCPAHAQIAANVTVDTTSSLGTIPPTAFGLNTATWDGLMNDAALPPLLKALDLNVLRYPGGSWSDDYHWLDNSGTVGSGVNPNPNDKFDNFMVLANGIGATPIITCNYGSNKAGTAGGDPTEAAGWVNYANNIKHYGVKYWEIGNEIYGNGYYGNGQDWETDLHDTDTTPAERVGDANLSPTTYGTNVVTYVNDMKAMDPTIQVGAVLKLPFDFPSGSGTDWDTKVLTACGTKIDFVIVHWYPEFNSDNDAFLLGVTQDIAPDITQIRAWINQFCGANAPNVKIFVTETNADAGVPGKQLVGLVNAMFASDNYMTWLENGVSMVDWWDLHNGPSTSGDNDSSLFGNSTFGDEGILSIGTGPEPAAETPFAPYYGIQMLSNLGKPGDKMVTTTSSQGLLTTHAVLRANGSVSVMLINKDLNNSYNANISLNGVVPGSAGTKYFYGQNSTQIVSSPATTGSSFQVNAPAYSITVVNIPPLPPLHTFPSGLQMIAAPASYTGDAWSQFINPSSNQIAIWQPGSNSYAVAPTFPADTLRAGSGYWVRFGASTTLFDTGQHSDPTKPVFITLGAGWNMVGDPFSTTVSISSLEVAVQGGAPVPFLTAAGSGLVGATLFTYPAGSTAYVQEHSSLSPYAGYWLWSKLPSVLIVPAPS
jgi:hypothetical protein